MVAYSRLGECGEDQTPEPTTAEIRDRHNTKDRNHFGKLIFTEDLHQADKDRGYLLKYIKELEAALKAEEETAVDLAENADEDMRRIEELQAQLAEQKEACEGLMIIANQRNKELEAERDDAVYCHKTSDENRSILQQQLDAVRPYLRHKEPCEYGTWVGKGLPLYNRCTCGLQQALGDK